MCDMLGYDVVIEPAWGMQCVNTNPVIGAWWMNVMDTTGKKNAIEFDVVEGWSLLIVAWTSKGIRVHQTVANTNE